MPDADALQIRLLGPLEVVVDGAPRVPRGVGERAVLSLLAVEAGRVVSADRLIDALWGERLPANPANALQLRVSKLRRALRDIGAAPGCIATRPPGYVLDVAPAVVDALRFAREVADARRAADDGSPRAAQRYRDALALWRGPPLVEFAAEAWAIPEVRRFEELRLAAIEERIAVELDAGRHAEFVDQLEALVAQHPLRERFHEQLMLALYRSGRQADALAAYRRARGVLADELGLEPSAALKDLEAAMLRQDVTLPVAVQPPVGRSGNLPARLASVVGREEDVAELVSILGQHRLVTVTGAGGTGKTTVALEAARRLAHTATDGAWFVDLSGVTEGSDVADAVAGALALPRTDPLQAESPESRLARRLATHAALIVLDNCEHLLDACATVAEHLVIMCPDLRILATSREALAVPGEDQYLLDPLATPPEDATADQLVASPAVQLFGDRARAAMRGFAIDGSNAADIGLLCRQLDGMPLAIELAAARVASLPLAQIVARLGDRFRLLTSGSRTAHTRQRTLRATVDWSHALLTAAEQTLFRRLAVFRGGWTPEAAEAICADATLPAQDILDLTSRLVDRSLVVADPRSGRFRLLETIRQYADERLAEAGEAEALLLAHATFYEHLAHEAEPRLRAREQTEWLTRLREDHDNFRAALAWSRGNQATGLDIGMRLAGALGWFWNLDDHVEGRHQMRETLRAADRADDIAPGVRARVLQAVAIVERPNACVVHPSPVCAGAAKESAALFEAAGEPVSAAMSHLLTAVEGVGGQPPESSLAAIDHAESVLGTADHLWGLALAEFIRMEVLMRTPDRDAATAAGRRAVARFHQVGDRWGVSAVLSHLGPNLRQLGRLTEAVEILEESLRIARDVQLWNTVQWVAGDLGLTQVMLDRDDDARRSLDEAERVARRYGLPAGQGLAFLGRGYLARRAGNTAAAREHFRQAVSLCEQVGSPVLTATALSGLGYAEESAGELDRADDAHHHVLQLARTAQAVSLIATGLEGLAGVAAARGDTDRASELLGRAAGLRARHEQPPHALEHPDIQRVTRLAQQDLGAEEFRAAFARGREQPTLDDSPAIR